MSGLSARMQGLPKEEKRPGHLNLKGSRHSRPEPHLMTPRQEAKAPLSLPDRPSEHAETGNHAQSSSCGSLPHRPRHCGGLESRGGACRQLRRGAQRLRRRLQQPGNDPGRVPGLLQPLLDSNLPGYRHPVPPWRSNRLQQRLPVTDAMPWRQFQLPPPSRTKRLAKAGAVRSSRTASTSGPAT